MHYLKYGHNFKIVHLHLDIYIVIHIYIYKCIRVSQHSQGCVGYNLINIMQILLRMCGNNDTTIVSLLSTLFGILSFLIGTCFEENTKFYPSQ